MLCRVLRGAEASTAGPLAWERLGSEQVSSRLPGGEETASPARPSQFEQELVRREQQAFESGYRKAIAELQAAAGRFARAAEELLRYRRDMRRSTEQELVRLAVTIARRILRRELSVDPNALSGIVKAALESLEAREANCVRVHPEDVALVERCLAECGIGDQIKVSADPQLARGSAILETAHGSLDASVETQLEEIERGLLDRLP